MDFLELNEKKRIKRLKHNVLKFEFVSVNNLSLTNQNIIPCLVKIAKSLLLKKELG